ncbi:MAG: Gfo/Idh/MocA family protein, partial [bacterium]
GVDAVAIATPASTHSDMVRKALEHDKHVFVEKPLAYSEEEALELTKLAETKSCQLMIGHIMLYHPTIEFLMNKVQKGDLGDISYAYTTRVNLGLIRADANVLLNLGVQ